VPRLRLICDTVASLDYALALMLRGLSVVEQRSHWLTLHADNVH